VNHTGEIQEMLSIVRKFDVINRHCLLQKLK